MNLRRGPFWWPIRRIGVVQSTSPDLAWPGLHRKPLDAAIGQLLAPYCPGGRQGNNQQNNNAKCTHFAVHFDSHHDVATQYCTHCLMEEVRGFHKHKATKHHHRASTCSDITNQTHQHRLFLLLHHEKGLDLKCWPLITIGVWHIKKLMRST